MYEIVSVYPKYPTRSYKIRQDLTRSYKILQVALIPNITVTPPVPMDAHGKSVTNRVQMVQCACAGESELPKNSGLLGRSL
jgi:hypothetical protein